MPTLKLYVSAEAGYHIISPAGTWTSNLSVSKDPSSTSLPSSGWRITSATAALAIRCNSPQWETITFYGNNTTNIGGFTATGSSGDVTAALSKTYNYNDMSALTLKSSDGNGTQLVGTGNKSIVITIAWEYSTTKCGAPTSVSVPASSTTSSVDVSWSGATAGTNNSITGYIFQARDSTDAGETYGSWSQVKTVSSTATSGTTSLPMPTTLGTFRQFRVQTIGNAGSSYYSDWSNTYGPCIRSAIAQAPNSVIVSNTTPTVSETITVSWTGAAAGVDDTISGYAVLRSDAVDGDFETIGTVSTSSTSGSMTTTSSDTFGETYYYRVQTLSGTNPAYNSPVSTVYAAATSGYGKPTVPTDFAATPNQTVPGGVVRLSWSASTDGYLNPVTGYQIVRSTSVDGVYSDVGNTTTTSFMAPAPSSEATTYYYKVCAVGTINGYNSAYTATPVTVNAVAAPAVTGGVGRTNAIVL